MNIEQNTKTQTPLRTRSVRFERLVSGLRSALHLNEDQVSDEELMDKTKGTLTRQLVEIEIAKEDFAKAAKPIVEKAAADIKKAFSRIKLYR